MNIGELDNIEVGNYADVARAALADAWEQAEKVDKNDHHKYAVARAAVGQLAATMSIAVILNDVREKLELRRHDGQDVG